MDAVGNMGIFTDVQIMDLDIDHTINYIINLSNLMCVVLMVYLYRIISRVWYCDDELTFQIA